MNTGRHQGHANQQQDHCSETNCNKRVRPLWSRELQSSYTAPITLQLRTHSRQTEEGWARGEGREDRVTWQPTGKLPDSASSTSLSFICDTPAGRSVVNLHHTASQMLGRRAITKGEQV